MQEKTNHTSPFLYRIQQISAFLKTLFKHDAQGLLFPVVLIVIIGFVNGYSATYTSTLHGGDWGPFVKSLGKQIAFLAVGAIFGIIFYRIDYRKWLRWEVQKWLFIGICILMVAIFIPGIGHGANGAQRWIGLPGGLTLQPSEFAKLGAIIWAAYTLDRHVKKHDTIHLYEYYNWGQSGRLQGVRQWWGRMVDRINALYQGVTGKPGTWQVDLLLPAFTVVPFIYVVLTMLQPDMGTSILIIGFPVIMAACVGFYKKHYKYLWGIGALGIVLFIVGSVFKEYRLKRLTAYIDPWSDSTATGYQVTQSILSVSLGGLFGEGITKGISKYNYLPEAHTDFAFSIWAQETGLLGVVFVIFLFLLFARYGLSIARHSRDFFGQVLATGLTFFIILQAFFNIAMVAGVTPVTGVPLPFISYGGSSLVTNFAAVGILLNIARRNEYARKKIGTTQPLPSIGEETRHRFQPRS